MTAPVFSLPAARREAQVPEGLPIEIADGVTLLLPAEFPTDVLDPFLNPELDLAGTVAAFVEVYEAGKAKAAAEGKDEDDAIGSAVVELLTDRPSLPLGLINAIYDAYKLLFGAAQFEQWAAQRPSINDYARLTSALIPAYGVSLGKFGSSSEPSDAGTTSSQTSSSTATASTRARSGAAKARSRASSASAD